MPHRPLIACSFCGTVHGRVDPEPGGRALCHCCHCELYRRGRLSAEQWVALAWAGLIVFAWAQAFPIAHLSILGLDVNVTFWQALRLSWDRGYYGVSVMAGLVGFWFPLMRIALTLWALQSIVSHRPLPDLSRPLRWLGWLTPWAMASVLVLAMLVAFVKLAGLAQVQIGPGLPGFFALIFLIAGLSRWDAHALWRLAEDRGRVSASGVLGQGVDCAECGYVQPSSVSGRCRRCHGRLRGAGPGYRAEVWALVLAAALFYIPANLLPVMRVQTLLGGSNHTILGGVLELWRVGSWDLALIVFVASVMVPVTKLFALAFLLLHPDPASVEQGRRQTRLYEIVERIGQWSMLDVFVVVWLAAMANFPGLSQIQIGPAALNFGMVVVLTMAATLRYDPRRDWKSLRERVHD
ncbi:MAG TPA: paraquat-inducible protein A [Castellaniella sp.]|uniref:paraquat-inducible protein A n=1 Tax=Castellaniella sp. TaxID=1955812 RepID=UPI002EE2C4B6